MPSAETPPGSPRRTRPRRRGSWTARLLLSESRGAPARSRRHEALGEPAQPPALAPRAGGDDGGVRHGGPGQPPVGSDDDGHPTQVVHSSVSFVVFALHPYDERERPFGQRALSWRTLTPTRWRAGR